ncbi:MAG: carboxypeptidase regulatory-like domain-containing protein, partial [Acidobacteria bacterium]|nr:carboxypeptidase regulatory-like domain-containing protein [Acidobacteriota bacterium]
MLSSFALVVLLALSAKAEGPRPETRIVEGLVVDGLVADDLGLPVKGAHVTLVLPGEDVRRLHSASGPGGAIRFELPAGTPATALDWRATAKEHVSARGSWGGEAKLVVTLTRAERVTGRVVDFRREPVAGATISLLAATKDGAETDGGAATSDERGEFALFVTLPGEIELVVRQRGYLPARVNLGRRKPGANVDLRDVALPRGRALRGVVTDARTGDPLAGVVVTPNRQAFGSMGLETRTDAFGRYELTGFLEDERVVRAVFAHPGFASVVKGVEDGEVLDVALRPGGTLAGRLCPELAASLGFLQAFSAEVGLGRAVPVDADGSFELRDLAPGRYRVLA